MAKVKRLYDRIPALIMWLFFGYLVVVNSQYSAETYTNYPGMEHITLNTLRLGYAIIGGAIFDFFFLSIRDHHYRTQELLKPVVFAGDDE